MQSNDNGSTMGGIMVVIAVIAAFAFGYHIRGQGYEFNVSKPPTQQEIQRK